MGLNSEQVVIVGGGPAGASISIMLARGGLKPLVLESNDGPAFKVGECLPPSARPILEQLGISELMPGDGHLPSYGNRSVWGGPVPVERDFIFGTQGHGWQLNRLKFEAALAARARDEGTDWRYGARLTECSCRAGRFVLSVRTPSGSETIEADLVVDATGRSARLARRLGARRIQHDRLIGVALLFASTTQGRIAEQVTLVEAVPHGWWYSAPLPGGKLMVAYMTDSDLAGYSVRGRNNWLALLGGTSYTMRRVQDGGYGPVSELHILQANSSRLDAVAGERWLAVGDAAAAFDPLSSYGISSALGSGYYAASAILDLFGGSPDALSSYGRLIDEAYARYLFMHYGYYALERRWMGETFWRRRHEQHPSHVAHTRAGAL